MPATKRKPPRKPDGHRQRAANIPGYKTELQTAEDLGVGVRTLRQWRHFGKGPAYTRIGDQILYRLESLAAWVRSLETQPVRAV